MGAGLAEEKGTASTAEGLRETQGAGKGGAHNVGVRESQVWETGWDQTTEGPKGQHE